MNKSLPLPLPLFLLGLVTLYIGERTLADTPRLGADALGALLIGASLLMATVAWRRAYAERRRAYGWVLAAYGVCLVALLGYSFLAWPWPGMPPLSSSHRVMLQVAWPAVLLLGLLPAIAMELAIGSMARTPTLEIWRVRLASRSARLVVLGLITFAGVNYAANVWNRKIDLSYFKTSHVGGATAALVHNLTQPVTFVLFFPPGNDVLEQARTYVDELAHQNPLVTVEVADQALDPDRARDLKVRSNGYLVVSAGTQHELLRLDLDAEEARATLRNLDAEVQQRLLKVVKPARIAYFTTGHMERDYVPSNSDKRPGLSDLKNIFEMQGYSVRRLGLAEGLGSEVPADATLVCIIGPEESLSGSERAALQRYLQKGGRALIALDPDHGVTEDELLAPLGLNVSKALVGNERYLVRVEGRGESPHDLVTSQAAGHPITRTLGENPGRMGVVLLGAGNLTRTTPAPADVHVTFALHGMPLSWTDRAHRTAGGAIEFAAAVEKTIKPAAEPSQMADANQVANAKLAATANNPEPMRVVVVGDADFATNGVVRNPGNAYFVMDSLRWLGGDDASVGITESEVDLPLIHRKEDDAVWFYGSSFLIPAMVLASGLAFTRRAGRAGRRE